MSMRSWFAVLAVSAVCASLSGVVRAGEEGEKEVKAADVPKPVTDAVAKRYTTGKVTHWSTETEDNKTTYEARVEITTKGADGKESTRVVEVTLMADGKFVEEEENIKADALPAEVKKAIAEGKYAKAKVGEIEKSSTGEKLDVIQYEVHFELDGKKYEVVYDPKGKVVKEEGPEDAGKGGDMK